MSDWQKQRARELRTQMTDAERRLWDILRERQISGFKFRRQLLLGKFIVDFACLEARLVLEVDGGQHGGEADCAARRLAVPTGIPYPALPIMMRCRMSMTFTRR